MWPLLLLSATTALFVLPLLPALHEWRRERDVTPLAIDATHAGRTTYFAERFRKIVEEAGAGPKVEWLGPALLPDGTSLPGEIRFREDITTGARASIEGALVEGDLVLGGDSTVSRWAHARHIRVGANAVLHGRLSAERQITLLGPCRFTRVSAPTISCGPAGPPAEGERKPLTDVHFTAARRVTSEDLVVPPHVTIHGDLVVRGDLVVGANSAIAGSAKAYGTIRLESGATVAGALVAVGPLEICANCTLGGPVVSERAVHVGGGTTIGTLEQPTTVSAPRITVDSGAELHGTLWARDRGDVLGSSSPPVPSVASCSLGGTR